MKRIAIQQSNYIPWKGYFDMINMVDEFIFLDEVQYTRADWRNRNTIKTLHGLRWLSIPIMQKGKRSQKISEARTLDNAWRMEHWASLQHHYAGARSFGDVQKWLEPLYFQQSEDMLSAINQRFIRAICDYLGITTVCRQSRDYALIDGKQLRMLSLCKQAGATELLCGPRVQGYLDASLFEREGIAIRYMDYAGYPEYRQFFPPFVHQVSILDLLFHEGKDAKASMLHFDANALRRHQPLSVGSVH